MFLHLCIWCALSRPLFLLCRQDRQPFPGYIYVFIAGRLLPSKGGEWQTWISDSVAMYFMKEKVGISRSSVDMFKLDINVGPMILVQSKGETRIIPICPMF